MYIVCQHQSGWKILRKLIFALLSPFFRSNELRLVFYFQLGKVTQVKTDKQWLICNSSPFSDSDKLGPGLWEVDIKFILKRCSNTMLRRKGIKNIHLLNTNFPTCRKSCLMVIGAKLADQEIMAQFVVGWLLCLSQDKNLCFMVMYVYHMVYKWMIAISIHHYAE